MKSFLSLLFVPLLLLSSLAHEIEVPASVPGGSLIVAKAKGKEEAKGFAWLVVDPRGQMLIDPAFVFRDPRIPDTIVIAGGEGKFQLMLMTSQPDGTLEQAFATVIRGAETPQPTPTPTPDPTPTPTPTPEPPGPAPGPRNVLMIWESEESTPYISALINKTRSGTFASYLKEHNHKMYWLDDDLIDANGKPAPSVESWRPYFKDLQLPACIIAEPATRTIIKRESILDPATKKPYDSNKLLELIKSAGG